jgi:hypothetical protein
VAKDDGADQGDGRVVRAWAGTVELVFEVGQEILERGQGIVAIREDDLDRRS